MGEAEELRFESRRVEPRGHSLSHCGLQDFCGGKKKNALWAVSESKSHFVAKGKKYPGLKSKSRQMAEREAHL